MITEFRKCYKDTYAVIGNIIVNISDGYPERDEIIQHDEITGMIIDLETLSPDDFYNKYFDEDNQC